MWSDGDRVRAAYGATIEYSLSALISFVLTYGDDNLVLVVLGDHQPATIVSGDGAGHDVPVSIISKDPAVLDGDRDPGAGRAGLNPIRRRRCGGWTRSTTGSSMRSTDSARGRSAELQPSFIERPMRSFMISVVPA